MPPKNNPRNNRRESPRPNGNNQQINCQNFISTDPIMNEHSKPRMDRIGDGFNDPSFGE
jgi:hypothetical protein